MKKLLPIFLATMSMTSAVSTLTILPKQQISLNQTSTSLKNSLVSTSGNYLDINALKESGKNLISDYSSFINIGYEEFSNTGTDASILGSVLYIEGKSLTTVVNDLRNSDDDPYVMVTLSFSKSDSYPLVGNENFKNYLYINDYSSSSLVPFWKIKILITARTSSKNFLGIVTARHFINYSYDIDLDSSIINEMYKLAETDTNLASYLSKIENNETISDSTLAKQSLNNAYYEALGIVFPWIKNSDYDVDLSSIYYYWDQIKNMNGDFTNFKQAYIKSVISQYNLTENDSIWNHLDYTIKYSAYQTSEKINEKIDGGKSRDTIISNYPISIAQDTVDNWDCLSGESTWGNMRSWNFFYGRNSEIASLSSTDYIVGNANTGYIYSASSLNTNFSDFINPALVLNTNTDFTNKNSFEVEDIGDNSLKITYWVTQILGTTNQLKTSETVPTTSLANDQYVILSMIPIVKVISFPNALDDFNSIIKNWKNNTENIATLKNEIPYTLLTSENYKNYIATNDPIFTEEQHKKFNWYLPEITSSDANKTSMNLYYDIVDDRDENLLKLSSLTDFKNNFVTVTGFISTSQYLNNVTNEKEGFGIQVKKDIQTNVTNFQDINKDNINDFIEIDLPSYVGNEISHSIVNVTIDKTNKTVTVQAKFNYQDSHQVTDSLVVSKTLTLSDLKLNDNQQTLNDVLNNLTVTLNNPIPVSLVTSDNWEKYITVNLNGVDSNKYSYKLLDNGITIDNDNQIFLKLDVIDNTDSKYPLSSYQEITPKVVTGFISTSQYLNNVTNEKEGFGIQVKKDIQTNVTNFQDINKDNITDFIEIDLPSYVGNEISHSIENVTIDKTNKTVTVQVKFNYQDSKSTDSLVVSKTLTLSDLKLNDNQQTLNDILNKLTVSLNESIPVSLVTSDNWEKYITVNLNGVDSNKYSYKLLDNGITVDSDNQISLKLDIIDNIDSKYPLSSYQEITPKVVTGFITEQQFKDNVNQELLKQITPKTDLEKSNNCIYIIDKDNWLDYFNVNLSDDQSYQLESISYLDNDKVELNVVWTIESRTYEINYTFSIDDFSEGTFITHQDYLTNFSSTNVSNINTLFDKLLEDKDYYNEFVNDVEHDPEFDNNLKAELEKSISIDNELTFRITDISIVDNQLVVNYQITDNKLNITTSNNFSMDYKTNNNFDDTTKKANSSSSTKSKTIILASSLSSILIILLSLGIVTFFIVRKRSQNKKTQTE